MRATRGLRGVLVCLLVLALCSSALAFSYYSPLPAGPVGLSRPTISQRFVLGDGERFAWAKMWLDGVEVTPAASDSTGVVSYVPPAALGAGTHQVRLEVQVTHPKQGYYYNPLKSEFSFTVAVGALAALPDPTAEAYAVLAHLNGLRVAAGLPAMAMARELCAAATGHATYQAALGQLTHSEDPSKPLYFGADPKARAEYYCYSGGLAEVIAGGVTGTAAVDGWLATLYHRLPLVDPGNVELGYGQAPGTPFAVSVVNVGPAGDPGRRVRWPYPNQTGVPRSWPGLESPDPFRLYPGVRGPVGYTVTLSFEKRPASLTLSTATLTQVGGGGVQVMTFRPGPGQDEYLDSAVAMIPYSPLAAGTYEARFAGTVDFGQGPVAYDERWSFTTVGATPPPPPDGQIFSDVPASHPAAGAIAHLVSLQVINGYPDGTYRPLSQITRAEFAKILVEAAGWARSTGEPSPFADTAGHWAAQLGYIQAAVRAGAIIGFPDGTFRPQNSITRAEALKTAAAASGLGEAPAPPGGYPYVDVHSGLWYAGWTQSAHAAGIIGGAGRWPLWTATTLAGDTAMTRAEAALLVSNWLSR